MLSTILKLTRRILALCLLCLVVIPPLVYAEPRTLRMGLEQNPPLSGFGPSGKAEGVFVDLMDEIARLEGWQIEYLSCPQAECLALLDDNRIDRLKSEPDSAYYRSLQRWITPQNSWGMPWWLKLLLGSLAGITLLLVAFILLLRRSIARKTNQLQAVESTYRSIFDNAPIGIFQSTPAGRLISINSAFASIFGYPSPEAMLHEIHDVGAQLYADPDQRLRIVSQLQTKDSLVQDDLEFIHRDGSHFFGTIYIRAVRKGNDPDQLIFDGFLVDSTERRTTQEILLQHEKMLMIGGLAAGMAHEINNPLGIIAQDLQNLQRRLSPDLPANRAVAERLGLDLNIVATYLTEREITGYVQSIAEAVRRTSRIIDNMLQFSRQGSANHQLAPLHEVVDHALELAGGDFELRKMVKSRDLQIQRTYAPDLPLVPMNITEIEQVLINLLKNAAQALAGWPGEHTITISTSREGNYAVLSLCDTGPGMTEEVRLRVFEPFFTTKPVGSGTGLGLAVSHAIITKNHKGLISVTSSPGKGSCFTIRLPLVQETNHA